MQKSYFNNEIHYLLHGGDYNPEQWLDRPDILKEDTRLMKLAGMNSATIGVFSWSVLQPEEGRFDFSFLDETMDRLEKIGAKVVLATPSGARPRWLAKTYPEVMRMDRQGHRDHFQGRHNHCFTSPVYREKVKCINQKLARRYGNHPALALWHISNEFSGECHCPLCHQAFREYVKEKYHGDLDLLNHEWWTTFWSHRYTSWDQIEPGDQSIHGLELEWKRFVTDQTIDFMKHEIASLREITPNIPVTTNMMQFWGLNNRKLSQELDVASWDSYPLWHTTGKEIEIAAQTAFWHDYFRSVKQKPFLLMESTPSQTNWAPYNKLKRPGMHRLSSLQAIAHGSDSVQYFQWRKSRGSSEKFHGAVVDHQGTEHTRVFQEVAQLGKTLNHLKDVAGCRVKAEVGLMVDTENEWALEQCQGFCRADKKYIETVLRFHQAFWKQGINVDIVFPDSELSNYKLIVAPMLYMTPAALIEKLAEYVREGGTLLSGYMTGMVNENDLCWLGGFPGGELKEVFGLWAEETDTLYPQDRNAIVFADGTRYEAVDYCEVVHPSTAEVLAVFESDYYQGYPAVCQNKYGKGAAFYLSCRDTGEYTDAICRKMAVELDIRRNVARLPQGVTAHTRQADGVEFLFLENYTEEECSVAVEGVYKDAETGGDVSGDVSLPAFGCRVLRR